jgi:redox-sensitive bicupin YhaK (pirin superfamily)
LPDRAGDPPAYGQKAFDEAGRDGRWQVVASPDGRDESLAIRSDAVVSLADLDGGRSLAYGLPTGRSAWLQVLRGSVGLNGQALEAGDGAAVSGESALELRADGPAEVLLFDLA